MRAIPGAVLLIALLIPATASAGTGVCSSDEWDAVCVGDYHRAYGSCADEGAEREGTGVSSPLLTVAGERECHRAANSQGSSESLIVHAAGVEAKWRHYEAESEGFGHQDMCFVNAGGNVGFLHLGYHGVDCPAGSPPEQDWGHLLP